jgi:hypothetical protein
MKKENVLAALILTFIIITLFFSVLFTGANAAPTNVTFTVNLTITGNAAPTISWVQSGLSANPVESSARIVYVAFNASDNNGYSDLNYNTAKVVLIINGEPHKTSSTCVAYANTSLTMQLNCTVSLQYYDIDGAWTINASINDGGSSHAEDIATTLTYGQLQAIRSNTNAISFGSVSLGTTSGASNDPLVLNNTGNQNFTQINITAYSLIGQSNPSQMINASNLYVNASLDNFGDRLANNTVVKLNNASLSRDVNGVDNNRNIYFWVNVPSSGLSNQLYVSGGNWTIEVFP